MATLPLASFDARIGGTPEEARTELMLLGEFADAIRELHFRHERFEAGWDGLEEVYHNYQGSGLTLSLTPTSSAEALVCWFEFIALTTTAAALADRLGKVLAMSHQGVGTGRLDRNIEKLSKERQLSWALRRHIAWLGYLADLRNCGLHRLMLFGAIRSKVVDGVLHAFLPDHLSVADRGSVDSRDLTYQESRELRPTARMWNIELPLIVADIFNDYFFTRGR